MNGEVVPIRVIGHDSIVTVTRVNGYDSSNWNHSSSYRLNSKSNQGIYYGDSSQVNFFLISTRTKAQKMRLESTIESESLT